MKALDLFCCQGGMAAGLTAAGFTVTGVDIDPQPRYPFAFIQADALALPMGYLRGFDLIHASPPCQAYTLAQRIQGNAHPDLVAATRAMLLESGVPYCIENVEGAPLRGPVTLCGSMFPGLAVYRHRLFETSFPVLQPPHPTHVAPLTKMGRAPVAGQFMHVVGNFSGVAQGKVAMGIDWMNRDGLREAIPPAFGEYIGRAAVDWLLA